MRNIGSGFIGKFQIVVDLLGAPNQVQTRTYVDDYFVVVTPAIELPVDRIRHAYLRYMTDPLALKNSDVLRKKASLHDYALASPILEPEYRADFTLFASECFARAVEARLDRRPAMASESMREGFVLTPVF